MTTRSLGKEERQPPANKTECCDKPALHRGGPCLHALHRVHQLKDLLDTGIGESLGITKLRLGWYEVFRAWRGNMHGSEAPEITGTFTPPKR
jgi:hypothetical protein